MTEGAPEAAPLLIVRFGSLGDVVLTFAAGAALKEARPERPIHYLVKDEYAELVRAQPWVDAVHALAGAERDVAGAAAWGERLGALPWSGVLDLQDNARSRFLLAGIGAPVARWQRRGLARRWWVWSRPLQALGYRPPAVRSAWLRYLDAARAFGARSEHAPRVEIPAAARDRLDAWWRERWAEREVVALVPAAAWPTKEWPEEHQVALLHELVGDGYGVCVISTAPERDRLPQLREAVQQQPAAAWWTGSLLEVTAALARSRVVVAPDTGLVHLAAGCNRPIVVLFGSTRVELGFGPAADHVAATQRADLRCRPCDVHGKTRCPLGHHGCMRGLGPGLVREAVRVIAERSR